MSTGDNDVLPRAQRVPTSIVATVSAGKRVAVPFTIHNLSVTGAKLEGPLALARGERIKVVFECEGERVELVAEVVRVDSEDLMTDQIAARFISPSDEAQSVIQHLVTKMLDAQQTDAEADPTIVIDLEE